MAIAKMLTDDLVGTIQSTNKWGNYEIIELLKDRAKNKEKRYRIRFFKTNYEKIVSCSSIKNKNIMDVYIPSLAGPRF